jgi:hypothetical protein
MLNTAEPKTIVQYQAFVSGPSKESVIEGEIGTDIHSEIGDNYGAPSTMIQWARIEFPEDLTSSDQVTVTTTLSDDDKDFLDNWFALDLEYELLLTGKPHGDNFYAFIHTDMPHDAGLAGADSIRIWNRHGEEPREAFIYNFHATHSFWLDEFDGPNGGNGEVHAWLVGWLMGADGGNAHTFDHLFDNTLMDGIRCISTATIDGTVMNTADGDDAFFVYEHLGHVDYESGSPYKVQYYPDSPISQYHLNAITRFTHEGIDILAITSYQTAECILFKDPWVYTSAEGGGSILQRFGTPHHLAGELAGVFHYYGVTEEDGYHFNGMHNPHYHAERGTVSIFVNQFSNNKSENSHVFEFKVRLVPETPENAALGDVVFNTEYNTIACDFKATAGGGVRPLGKSAEGDTVYMVSSGSARLGGHIVDMEGNTQVIYTNGWEAAYFYDPFSFIQRD